MVTVLRTPGALVAGAVSRNPNSAGKPAQGNPAQPLLEVTQGSATRSLRHAAMAASAQVFKKGHSTQPGEDRQSIATAEQIEAYRHAQTIGEARYSAVLFSNLAGRAEVGVSEAQALAKKAVWVKSGPEVDAFAEVVPTVRERTKLIRDYMLHWTIAGEALDVDTPVATPEGFTRMGDLIEGDVILGGDGKPTTVVKAHPIQEGRPTYEVTLTSGARVVADAEHLWAVRDRVGRELGYDEKVLTTEQILANLKDSRGRHNYTIDMTVVEGEHAVLPADPYLLGYWLGDGTSVQSSITAHPEDQDHLRVQVEKAGYQMTHRKGRGFHVGIVGGFLQDLRNAGVMGDKHIPGEYLRASSEQRLALLQGLIDSDGHIDKSGRGEFSNTNKELLLGFIELASSLGMRVGQPRRNRVGFSPCGVQAARLPRKAERIKTRSTGDQWRSIVSIEPVPSRPVRCITVDSTDQTFLVTEHMVKTHNCYLVARERRATDPGYVDPPINEATGEPWETWDDHLKALLKITDVMDPDFDEDEFFAESNPNLGNPIWEIVSVLELRRLGKKWEVQHDGGNWLELRTDDPVIRMWNPKPGDRREAWSPFIAMAKTLREIEWMTMDIFTQVRSRLKSAGVWFLPDNLTFPPPPPDTVEGGAEAIAEMNEAELFAIALSNASMELLDGETVAMPTVVLADPVALGAIDKSKLITFWNELDSASMTMRSDAVRRFALGMDLPPEQVLGSSGLAVTDSGGSAGSVNHWGVWANEEQTISAHIEPALDIFTGILTEAFLRPAVRNTTLVIAYDTISLRMRQDRSEQAIKLYELGLLNGQVTLSECGFDPESDRMGDKELARWILVKAVSGSWSPEQMGMAAKLLGTAGLEQVSGNLPDNEPRGTDGKQQPTNTDGIEHRGKPQEDHEHNPAPYAALEMLVLRALEKNGNRLLNEGNRGRDRKRIPAMHNAHCVIASGEGLERTISSKEFDFSLAETVLPDFDTDPLARFCAEITNEGREYDRADLIKALSAEKAA